MRRRFHGKRALLNGPGFGTSAAIVAEIEDTSTWADGLNGEGREIKSRYHAEPAETLQIANCDRSIAFELPIETADDRRNSLRKVDTMIDALSRLREGMVVEHARYVKRARGIGDDDG